MEALLDQLEAGSEANLDRQEPPAPGAPAVVLQYYTEQLQELRLHPPRDAVTNLFTGLLRNRRLWRDVRAGQELMRERCMDVFEHLGGVRDRLGELAGCGVLQLVIEPSLPESCFRFPWEFVLAEATRSRRRRTSDLNRAFAVIRHCPELHQPRIPKSLLVVESAPGRIAEQYNFESERKLVCSSLDLGFPTPLSNPELDQIRARVIQDRPDIIHLTGVDSIQGAELQLSGVSPMSMPPPGMYFRSGSNAVPVPFPELADAITAGGAHQPYLVSFNVYHSLLAAVAVLSAGATSAIAFQDDVDDEVAEQFFAAFYAEWKRSGWELAEGFRRAWLRLGNYASKVRGTGIILWSRLSLIDRPAEAAARVASAPQRVEEVRDPQTAGINPREYIGVEFEKAQRLNYSLLHNGEKLFTKFVIRRLQPGLYNGVGVDVKLYAGMEVAQYQASFQLSDDLPVVDVNLKAKVPLTSQLTRSLAESIFTNVSFTVTWGPHIIEQQTERVELLPIDEWKDDDLNRKWLPSFVLPRDPSVRRVIDSAQRYLVALADDSGAGFDGYQSYDATPGLTLEERCRYIDAQVKAIWWTLIYDYNLGYINPPPTFTEYSQRLRTPTDVIDGKRGTCIDLALLLSACLEYIEIYPVVFLLRDHAFPGYCRSEQGYKQLGEVFVSSSAAATAADGAQQESWFLPPNSYAAIMKLVQKGELIPLETVTLTQRSGFETAVAEGLQNLRNRRHFHTLYDIRRARDAKPSVTPLPIWAAQS